MLYEALEGEARVIVEQLGSEGDRPDAVDAEGAQIAAESAPGQESEGAAGGDHREGLDGAQFVIRNPNAQTTCGCGSSFTA